MTKFSISKNSKVITSKLKLEVTKFVYIINRNVNITVHSSLLDIILLSYNQNLFNKFLIYINTFY